MRKHILLINPWIYDFSAFDLWLKPLGLLYLAGHLRQHGCTVHLIDCLDRYNPELLKRQRRTSPKVRAYGVGKFFRERLPKPDILKHIPMSYCRYGIPEDIFLSTLETMPEPSAILITSMMTYWYSGVFRAIELAKQRFPNIPVVLGGIYASLCFQHAQTHSHADYVVREHDPAKILQLVDDLTGKPHSYSSQNADENSPPLQLFHTYPAFDLYYHMDYACLLTSIGCPYRCTYCASHLLSPHFVQRPPEEVFQELLYYYNQMGIRNFAFYDDALLMHSASHLEPFLYQVIDANLACTFHTPNGLHARYITEQMADLMFKSGFKTIRLSLETIDRTRQQQTGGKVTEEEFTHAVTILKQAGFQGTQIGVYFFIGLPGQSIEETKETIRYVHSLGVNAHLCEYSPIPGTQDWPLLEQQGYVSAEDDPLQHNNSIFIFQNGRIHFDQMQELKDWVRALNADIKIS